MYLSILVYYKYFSKWNAYSSVWNGISLSVPETPIKWVFFFWEQLPDISQCSYLKHLRFPMNHFPDEWPQQPIWRKYNRPIWHHKFIILFYTSYIIPSYIGMTNWSWSQIQYLIPIFLDLGVEFSNSLMGPVPTEPRKQLSKHIWLSYCTINVRNYYFSCVIPQEDPSFHGLIPLKCALHCEGDLIGARL